MEEKEMKKILLDHIAVQNKYIEYLHEYIDGLKDEIKDSGEKDARHTQ